jgi:hypothetical protein
LTLIQHVGAGDNNTFGDYTIKSSIVIDLGLRAPVVISASPSNVDCAIAQNLQIPGSCFILEDGTANVTSVFAVEVGNPAHIIPATRFVVLTSHLIDAFFEFGAANAGKEFLIFVSGPNGTSRNLTSLPQGAPAGCPLGNEQGIRVSVTCNRPQTPVDGNTTPISPLVSGCLIERTDAGANILIASGRNFRPGATVTIGGVIPKKVKLKQQQPDGTFNSLVIKGGVCGRLPGIIIVTNPPTASSPAVSSLPFTCNQSCVN